jgi:hypothetical protein
MSARSPRRRERATPSDTSSPTFASTARIARAGEHLAGRSVLEWDLVPKWKELADKAWMWPLRATYDPLVVRRPTTWLLAEGWKLAGGPISARDVPGRGH